MTTTLNNDDAITVVEYNPEWVRLAEDEITIFKNLFLGKYWIIDIQHVGSTAIPGLAAKPIIDIYIGVSSMEKAQEIIEPIKNIGYQFWDKNPNKEKMFFVKGMPPFGAGRTHHIHVVRYDSDYWRARILFRDYLRSRPEECLRYAELKYQLMKDFPTDREAYSEAKFDYIESVLIKAGFKEKVRR